MNFPDWAPLFLVKLYEKRLSFRDGMSDPNFRNPFELSDPVQQIDYFTNNEEKFKHMSAEQIADFRASLSISALGLPEKVGTELLYRLITDLRMKPVWASLARRVKRNNAYIDFWEVCEHAILGWWSAQKLSPNQQRDYYLKIHEHALELSRMMNETAEFHAYSTSRLIDFAPLELLFDSLKAKIRGNNGEDEINALARYIFADGGPSIYKALEDIASQAIEFSQGTPIVLKPNSNKAAVHYFVRTLSQYLKEEYGTPLHDVVASTTGVIFDDPNIDSDYVSKLV